MKQKGVKKNLLSHSEAKVKLPGEYLKRYLNIIVNDGFTEQIDVFYFFAEKKFMKMVEKEVQSL